MNGRKQSLGQSVKWPVIAIVVVVISILGCDLGGSRDDEFLSDETELGPPVQLRALVDTSQGLSLAELNDVIWSAPENTPIVFHLSDLTPEGLADWEVENDFEPGELPTDSEIIVVIETMDLPGAIAAVVPRAYTTCKLKTVYYGSHYSGCPYYGQSTGFPATYRTTQYGVSHIGCYHPGYIAAPYSANYYKHYSCSVCWGRYYKKFTYRHMPDSA